MANEKRLKVRRLTAGNYEAKFFVNLRWEDGAVLSILATATIESMKGEWDQGGWNLRIECPNPRVPDATIELTNGDEQYDTKAQVVDSINQGTLRNWKRISHLGWCIGV
jgi:hypothetical protein